MSDTRAPDDLARQQIGAGGCLARVFWMLIGNVVLAGSAMAIAGGGDSRFGPADAVFWITAAAMAAVRYVDIARLKGFTATGVPADMTTWRRYVVVLAVAAVAVWGLAHLVGHWRS